MKYLAIDPGNTAGWAKFDATGDIVDYGKIKGQDNFLDWLEELDPFPEHVIYEEYHNYPGATGNTWSTNTTSKQIGAIERICRKKNATIHKQYSSVLKIGMKYAGLPIPKGHIPDDHSAIAHGVYYLQTHGIRESRVKPKNNNS